MADQLAMFSAAVAEHFDALVERYGRIFPE
jgi:hypothetical protein